MAPARRTPGPPRPRAFYTPPRGRIHLAARQFPGEVVLSVHNDGPVIPVPARAALFDKYVQAGAPDANRRAGWGLGLYFCKLCVQAHGGRIGVEDEPGWATSFVVRLPVTEASA